MKKFLIVLLSLAVLIFSNCKKENVEPKTNNVDTTQQVQQIISIYGKWKLIDAYMYVENLETGLKTRYSHFSDTKSESSVRYAGAIYNIETIIKDTTTWEFTKPNAIPGYGSFILNGDTDNPYGFYVTYNNWTITENPSADMIHMQMGGSARPLRVFVSDYNNKICKFYLQEAYESINGANCSYFNELIFQKLN